MPCRIDWGGGMDCHLCDGAKSLSMSDATKERMVKMPPLRVNALDDNRNDIGIV